MQQAAACMDAAVSAALEDARKHGFPADFLPSGEHPVFLLLRSFKSRLQDAVTQLEVTLLFFLEGCSERKALHVQCTKCMEASLDLALPGFPEDVETC